MLIVLGFAVSHRSRSCLNHCVAPRYRTGKPSLRKKSYETAVNTSGGKADVFASIREMLMQYSPNSPVPVLGDSYQKNLAGIAVAKDRGERLATLNFLTILNDLAS